MGLNSIIYEFSLFSCKRKTNLLTKPAIIKSYGLKIFYLDDNGKIKYHDQGTTEPPEAIIINCFSEDRHIDLRGYWEEILADQREEYQTDITTYETITKFGETQPLVDEYRLIIKTVFSL